MKKEIILFGLIALTNLDGLYAKRNFLDTEHLFDKAKPGINQLTDNDEIRNGDLIFQTSLSEQSTAIQLATNSTYSHCGIVYNENGKFYVFEAIQPVMTTPLEKWIARG